MATSKHLHLQQLSLVWVSSWFQLQAPLSLTSLGSFLRLGAGISAWKSYDGLHATFGNKRIGKEENNHPLLLKK